MWPAALVAGLCFGITQFLVSNFVGPYLTDILSSIVAIIGLVLLLRVWKPRDDTPADVAPKDTGIPTATVLRAWTPYIFLVIFVLLWGYAPFKALLDKASVSFLWHGLDGQIQRLPPAVAKAGPYAAKFNFNLLVRLRARQSSLRWCSRRWRCGCRPVKVVGDCGEDRARLVALHSDHRPRCWPSPT